MTEQHDDGHTRRRPTRAEERIAALEAERASAAVAAGGAAESTAPETTAAQATGAQAPASQQNGEIERLRAELEAARREAADMRGAWQRSAADFANFKRRTEREREETLGLANASLLTKLLDVVDDYDRALAAVPQELAHFGWIEGLWLIEAKLRALLESEGVSAIEALGRPFDPREHEAVVHEETTSAPDGTVIGELQKGYRLRDRVLRPALVKVANNAGTHTGRGGNH